VEDSSNKGRVDMTVKFNGHIYLFEFKVVELLPEGKAIDQLKARVTPISTALWASLST